MLKYKITVGVLNYRDADVLLNEIIVNGIEYHFMLILPLDNMNNTVTTIKEATKIAKLFIENQEELEKALGQIDYDNNTGKLTIAAEALRLLRNMEP